MKHVDAKERLREKASLWDGVAQLTSGDELKSDRLVTEVERRILSGQLVPGERLPTEEELCDILGVSRSVVRDAVRSLAARGLVTVRQGRGMNVAEPSDEAFGHAMLSLLARSEVTMGEVLDARAMIETRLAPVAASTGSEQDWAVLEKSYLGYVKAVDELDWNSARDMHLTFHAALLGALHQPALELFPKPLSQIILISSAPPRQTAREDWEVESHWPIVVALRARDADAVERAMTEHFAVTREPARYEAFRALPFRQVFSEVPWAGP